MPNNLDFNLKCPLPLRDYPAVMMAHGGGGTLMRGLIESLFLSTFDNPLLSVMHDCAVFDAPSERLAFTTDSYVVSPLFFPGGDIGELAVYGTVNDLSMGGARPVYITCSMILEEGLPMERLWRIVQSMRAAADRTGVRIVTGDTKVVERGKADGIFINTAGIGAVAPGVDVSPANIRPGDVILLNGDVARHGIAIMASREGIEFETAIVSDLAPLAHIVQALLDGGIGVHCLRDLTRGGLAAALTEIASTAHIDLEIEEAAVPVQEPVQAACRLLGFDPLFVANEGRFVAFVEEKDAARALEIMRALPDAGGACRVGRVLEGKAGRVGAEKPDRHLADSGDAERRSIAKDLLREGMDRTDGVDRTDGMDRTDGTMGGGKNDN